MSGDTTPTGTTPAAAQPTPADEPRPVFTRPLLVREGRRPLHVEPVDGTVLRPVASRPPLREYLRLLWDRRHFIVADARARVATSNSGTLLGRAWLVLSPLLDAAVYLVIFGLLLRSSRGIDNFIGYLLIGVFLFRLTSSTVSAGARSLIAGRSLVRSFSFPRASLPLATVARQTLAFVPTLVLLVVLVLLTRPAAEDTWTPPAELLSWRWLLVPVVLALQLALNLGLTLIAARATARVPDLAQVVGVLMRFWLYGSAVFFSFDRFIDHPTLLQVVELNPMFRVLDMVRDCMLYGQTPTWESWAILTSWSVGLLVLGTVFFWRGEESYGSV
ncbi:ABC transporter permease [Cellulomonas telluris]|uniref:ABC transporter permease n=1 Tax=Cellulomonas telluris TaxID=2306636 RepID=UPI0010A7AF53|nr:ABC transporter permease [Cellulomonas telluris]